MPTPTPPPSPTPSPDDRDLYPPPSVYELSVRCPVPYCDTVPHRKCCNRLGYTLANAHRERVQAAHQAAEAARAARQAAGKPT